MTLAEERITLLHLAWHSILYSYKRAELSLRREKNSLCHPVSCRPLHLTGSFTQSRSGGGEKSPLRGRKQLTQVQTSRQSFKKKKKIKPREKDGGRRGMETDGNTSLWLVLKTSVTSHADWQPLPVGLTGNGYWVFFPLTEKSKCKCGRKETNGNLWIHAGSAPAREGEGHWCPEKLGE